MNDSRLLDLQADILFQRLDETDGTIRTKLYDRLCLYRKNEILLEDFKKDLERIRPGFSYYFFYLEFAEKNFVYTRKWTPTIDDFLKVYIFRYGVNSWKHISLKLFGEENYADNCRLRWLCICKKVSPTENAELIEECISCILSINKGNYKHIAKEIRNKYSDVYINSIECLLDRNSCYSFICAKITQCYINCFKDAKITLLCAITTTKKQKHFTILAMVLAIKGF